MQPPTYLRRPGVPVPPGGIPPVADFDAVLRELRRNPLRPYLDLTDTDLPGPIHRGGLLSARDRLCDPQAGPAFGQVMPPARYRDTVAHQYGLDCLRVRHPAGLPPPLRSAGWQVLLDAVEAMPALPADRQAAVLLLLCRLSLFDAVVDLGLPLTARPGRGADGWRVHQLVALALQKTAGRDEATSLLVQVAQQDDDQQARLRACVLLLVMCAKHKPVCVPDVLHWGERAQQCFQRIGSVPGWRDNALHSWYWRGMSFLPFVEGAVEQAEEMLDRAEALALSIPTDTPATRAMHCETMHPLLETRAKTAMIRGDLPRAVGYAARLAALDPADAKAHVTLAHVLVRADRLDEARVAYQAAVAAGPPWSSLAWLGLGALHEASGELGEAAHAYRRVLELDAHAVCARQRLAALAPRADDRVGAA